MNWIHTGVLITHVLGAALIIGVTFSSFIIQLKRPVSIEKLRVMGRLFKSIQLVFATQLLSGIYLAWSEQDKFVKNPLLGFKFLLFVLAAAAAIFVLRADKARAKRENVEISQPSPLWAWISLLVFLLIATLGVILAESAG